MVRSVADAAVLDAAAAAAAAGAASRRTACPSPRASVAASVDAAAMLPHRRCPAVQSPQCHEAPPPPLPALYALLFPRDVEPSQGLLLQHQLQQVLQGQRQCSSAPHRWPPPDFLCTHLQWIRPCAAAAAAAGHSSCVPLQMVAATTRAFCGLYPLQKNPPAAAAARAAAAPMFQRESLPPVV